MNYALGKCFSCGRSTGRESIKYCIFHDAMDLQGLWTQTPAESLKAIKRTHDRIELQIHQTMRVPQGLMGSESTRQTYLELQMQHKARWARLKQKLQEGKLFWDTK